MDKFSSAESAHEQGQDGTIVRELIEGAVAAESIMGGELDLSEIWNGSAFDALSASAKADLLAWAEGKGYPLPDSEDEQAATDAPVLSDAPAPSNEQAPEQEKTEKRESLGKRPRRVFDGYRIAHADDGTLLMKEDLRIWDDRAGEYRDNTIDTSIAFTKTLTRATEAEPALIDEIAERCSELRHDLDRAGVKVFFDKPKGGDKVYPKWKYEVDGEAVQERISDVPPAIMELVRANARYYEHPDFKAWYGPMMQRKREAILSAKLAEDYPDPKEPTAPVAKDTDRAAMEKEFRHETLLAAADALAEKIERLFTLPEQTGEYVAFLTDSAYGVFKHANRDMTPADANRVVREVLTARHKKNGALLAEIDKHLPEPPPEPELAVEEPAPESVQPVTEKVPATAVEHEPVAAEQPNAETAELPEEEAPDSVREARAEKEYATLRADLRHIADADTLDEYVAELVKSTGSGDAAVADASQRLLEEIELGRVGEASETRMTGLQRSPAEKTLFEKHPELNARNIRVEDDGSIVGYADPEDVEGSVSRIVSRVTAEALGGTMSAEKDAALTERLSAYLAELLLGKKSASVQERFNKKYAEFHTLDAEVRFHNVDELVEMVKALAEQVRGQK